MSLYKFCVGIVRIYCRLMFKIEVSGTENVPAYGGCLICPNHKSNYDPLMVAINLPRELKFLGKAEIFKNPVSGWFFKKIGGIPIKRGENDIGAIKACLSTLKSGCGLLLFPQGTRCEKIKKEDFKPGSVTMAKKSNVPIIPVGISGNYKFRKKVVIKFGSPITPEKILHLEETIGEEDRNNAFAQLLCEEIKALTE